MFDQEARETMAVERGASVSIAQADVTPFGALAPAAADEELSEAREEEVMRAGELPAIAAALALVACYLQQPVSTGGQLALPLFASLNNCLGWGITMASLASDRAGTDDVDVITLAHARATREERRMAR